MVPDWITPDWPAPASVHAVSTTRSGGVSKGVYASFNLGAHVGDDPRAVAENRLFLRSELNLAREPRWLKQVHGASVVGIPGFIKNPLSPLGERASRNAASGLPRMAAQGLTVKQESTAVKRVRGESEMDFGSNSVVGDASVTQAVDQACVIMTADCLPVLLCDRVGKTVAAAHCGWRSLAASVLENTLTTMQVPPTEILAWLGPAIGPDVYQVGDDVRTALLKTHPEADQAFEPQRAGKWLCDLYQIASQRLRRAGVTHIYGGGFCTYSDRERFFSYRREGECGRMATLIWLS